METPVNLLLALADDDFLLGYRDSEWTGIAPMLEEDIAMSSVSQDEIGHARAVYEMVEAATGRSVDAQAYGRRPREYRSCWLVEHHRRDWGFTIARRWLYETADDVRTESLTGSAFRPLAELLAKVRREERYHLLHFTTWLERLAASEEARPRLLAAMDELWPDALGFWERLPEEEALLAAGAMTAPWEELRARWFGRIGPVLREYKVPLPGPEMQARTGGRLGERSPGFEEYWADVTEVYRLDPQATW